MQRDAVALHDAAAHIDGGGGPVSRAATREISIQHIMERLYARAGARYIETLTALFVGSTLLVVVPGFTALLVPYFHATGGQYVRFVAAFELALAIAGLGTYLMMMRRHAALVNWVRGERSAEAAPAAWESAVAALPGTTAIALSWYAVCCVPPALYVSSVARLSWFGLLLFVIFLAFLVMGVAVFAYLFFEQALGAVVREIAPQLRSKFESRRRTLSLGTKLLVVLPAINIFTGSVVAAVSTNSLGLEGRLALTLGATLLVSMTISLVLTLMFRQSLLQRVESLQEAIGRVDRGDYSGRVLHLAGDEFDDVGERFNDMVLGLRERGVLRDALGSYIDASIALQVISEGEILQGREVEVTVLFLDIRDFTSFADRSTAGQVVGFLSDFFDLVIPIIRTHHGHPNKLLGDGLLAVFGAPAPLDGHADHALDAAREILDAVWRHYNGELRVGVGVHTGEVVAGTIGGGGKLDYTLIGDTVNVAARVQELTKDTGDPLLITDSTRRMLTRAPEAIRARGAHRLRGKAHRTAIYAVELASAPGLPQRANTAQ